MSRHTGRASSSYESQHQQLQQERARNNGIVLPLDGVAERSVDGSHSARAYASALRPEWAGAHTARAATHVQPAVTPVHKSGPDLSLLNIALTTATTAAAPGSHSSAATPRSHHAALPSVRGNKRSDALGSFAPASSGTASSAPPTAREADLPPAGSGRWSALAGPQEAAPGVAAINNSATARFLLERARAAAVAQAHALAAAGGVAAPAPSLAPTTATAPAQDAIANDSTFGLSAVPPSTPPTFESRDQHKRQKSRFNFNPQTAPPSARAHTAAAAPTESPRNAKPNGKAGPMPSPASFGSRTASNAGSAKHSQPLASPRTDRLDSGPAAKFPAVAGASDAPRRALATAPPPSQFAASTRRTHSVASHSRGPSSLSLTIPAQHTGSGSIVALSPISHRLDLSAVTAPDEKQDEPTTAEGQSPPAPATAVQHAGGASTAKRKDFTRKSLSSRRIAAFLRDALKNSMQVAAPSPPVSPRPQAAVGTTSLQRKASDLTASSASLGSAAPAMQRRGSNVASAVSITSSAVAATVGAAAAASASSQSAAQQAHNLLTMQDLLAEAWKLHARRSSFMRHDSQSSASAADNAATRGLSDNAHAISPALRAERAANMTRFISDVWQAILKDKTAAGVGITETHRQHAAARFERLFRREHDGADAHTLAHPKLSLVASGLGRHGGKVVARYFAQQAHYTELDLARNQLGDAGIKPLLKLLRKYKGSNSGGSGTTPALAEGAASSSGDKDATNGASTARVGRSGRNTDSSASSRRAASSSPSRLRQKPRAGAAAVRTGSVPPPQSRAAAVAAALARQSSMSSVAGSAVPPPPPPLRRLNLSYNSLSPLAFESIAAALPTSSLRMLDLSSDHASDLANRMGVSGARALAAALASLTCPLQDLRLAGVGSQGFRILMSEGLGKAAMYSQLQSLDVRGNWLSADAFVMLMKAARRGLVHLSVLRLARNRFSLQGAQCLFDYVRSTTALKTLDLAMCCISTTAVGQSVDAQGQAHGSAVNAPATDSSGNTQQPSAGREFCFQLLEAMARNPAYCSVEDLSLDENALGDIGSRQIGLALALLNTHLPNLKALSLVGCNIADTQWLSYGLSRNTTLTRLNLSANPIGDGGTIALALGLQGRLELDAPLMPILALRRRDGAAGFDEQEEAEEEERASAAIAAEAEAARQVELEAEAKRAAEQAAQHREAEAEAEPKTERKMLLQDALKDGDNLLLVEETPRAAPEPELDLLADATLKQASSAAAAAAAAREMLRLGTTGPITAPVPTIEPVIDDLDGPPRPRNAFWDLSAQQLNSARMQNARRVIVYSKRAHPISAMRSLNLTHTSMGDVGLIHLAQVISLNHALVSLSVGDNDLTSAGGLAMLNTLKAIQPKDTCILRVLDLGANRISSKLEEDINRITNQRKRSHDVQRVRAYKTELSSSKQHQRARLTGYIVSIKAAMDADEVARRKLATMQEDYARLQAEELAETAKLQADLDAILRDQRDLYTSQLPSYEDLVVRRVGAVLHANTQRTEELTQALREERTASAKISRKIDREIRPAMEQVRAEITLDHRPLLQLLESETKLLASLRSKVAEMKTQKTQIESTILEAYYAILRNSGRGSSKGDEPLDPEIRAPELYRSIRAEVEKLQQASAAAEAAAAAAESGTDPLTAASGSSVAVSSAGDAGTALTTAAVSNSSRVPFGQFSPSVSRRSSGGPLPSPFLPAPSTPPRKKHSLFFGAEGAAIDQENEAREIEQRQRAAHAPVFSPNGRPLTPRMGTALRYLSRWGEQAERAAIQHALIHAAQTTGRPIDKIMPASGPRSGALDLSRLTPRSRSAVQRLRGDLQTEWEMKRAQEEREARVRKRQEGGVPTAKKGAQAAAVAGTGSGSGRRKGRALGSAIPAASTAVDDDFDSFDGHNLSVSIDLVTSLLQLGPLTKIQGSTTLYAMAMRGFQRGDSVFVSLVHSADTQKILKAWESKYGVWNATTGKRVPPSQPRTGADSAPPPPLTMSCSTDSTSSVLIKLVSEKLELPISAISSLSFLEKRNDEHANAAAATAAAQTSGGGSSDLVRLIRERELKEVSAKKKKQAEMKQPSAAAASTATPRKLESGGGSKKKHKQKRSNKNKTSDSSSAATNSATTAASSVAAIAASSSMPIFTPQSSSLRTLSSSSRPDGGAGGSSVSSSQRASYDPSAYDHAMTKHHSSVEGSAPASHSGTGATPLLRPSPPLTASAGLDVTPRSKLHRSQSTSEESKEAASHNAVAAPPSSSHVMPSVSNLLPFGKNDLSAPPAAQQSARLSNRRR